MKYWVRYEMEYGIEVEDGHELSDDIVREALREAVIEDVGELPDDGTVAITLASPDVAVEYTMRISLKSPAYPGAPSEVLRETV